jgi:hypothetical protein
MRSSSGSRRRRGSGAARGAGAPAVRSGAERGREGRRPRGAGRCRRPLVTHFVGDQPCSGGRNRCTRGRAASLRRRDRIDAPRAGVRGRPGAPPRAYGIRHAALLNDIDSVRALPFDYSSAYGRRRALYAGKLDLFNWALIAIMRSKFLRTSSKNRKPKLEVVKA